MAGIRAAAGSRSVMFYQVAWDRVSRFTTEPEPFSPSPSHGRQGAGRGHGGRERKSLGHGSLGSAAR